MISLAAIAGFILGALVIGVVAHFHQKSLEEQLKMSNDERKEAMIRADRLTEAVASHAGMDVVLPAREMPIAEKGSGFFDGIFSDKRYTLTIPEEENQN